MARISERLILDETVKRTACDRCNTEESLVVKVYSKFFLLTLLMFAFSKRIRIECTSCHRIETSSEPFPRRVKDRIEAVLEDAQHPWYFYTGYVFVVLAILFAILSQ